MIAINFNTISSYHLDSYDEKNGLCVLVALGDFEGGELCFPQLRLIIQLKSEQVVAFRSHLLKYGNCMVTKGMRFSIVYYIHNDFFKKSNPFKSINSENAKEQDFDNNIENYKPTLRLKPTSKQILIPLISTDKRRNQIDLSKTRRGLKMEDEILDNMDEMEID